MIGPSGVSHSALCFLLLLFFPSVHLCPAQCQCTAAAGGGTRVLCAPGQISVPAGLNPDTKTLIITGRPSPLGTNHIPALRVADLTPLPNLEELSLTFAGLQDVQDNAFKSLRNLRRLSLHSNKIGQLTPLTFSGLIRLDFLDLTDNPGCTIHGDVFGLLTALKTLYLGGLGLNEARTQWFKSLQSLESLDLHGNSIESLESDFLQGLVKMKHVDLTGNRLQTLPPALVTTLSVLPAAVLTDNPWHCNCLLSSFKQFPVSRHTGTFAVCKTPQPLAYREVTSVPDGELKCLLPKILSCGGPYHVSLGDSIMLECEVEGDPFPEVRWTAPDGTLIDTSRPEHLTTARRRVNTTAVRAADLALHCGQWSVAASSSQGSATSNVMVDVATTTTASTSTSTTSTPTTTTATTTSTSGTATGQTPKINSVPLTTSQQSALPSTGLWFYVALGAFGLTALALISLILVAVVKLRNNQRQVGTERRRDSGLSLGSATETEVTVLSKPTKGTALPTDKRDNFMETPFVQSHQLYSAC